ncbi:MAG: CDP-alcohol phosphatidyltransferase family protein [Candidatus Altimarinota bacterium]
MPKNKKSIYLSDFEVEGVNKFRDWKDKKWRFLIVILANLGIKPIWLSFAGLFCSALTFFWLDKSPVVVLFLLVLSVIFDNLDGSLARFLGKKDMKGAWVDLFCDNLGLILVVLFSIYHGVVDGFLGASYLVNYLFMLTALFIFQYKNVVAIPVFRSKYWFYGCFLVLLFGYDIFEPFLVFMTVYMLVMNVFLYKKLYDQI